MPLHYINFEEDPSAPVPEDAYTLIFPHEDGRDITFDITPENVLQMLEESKHYLSDIVFDAIREEHESRGFWQELDSEEGSAAWLQAWLKDCVEEMVDSLIAFKCRRCREDVLRHEEADSDKERCLCPSCQFLC